MSLIGTLVGYVLTLFILVLIARMILDWVVLLGKTRQAWVSKAREVTRALTEPVIAPVRKVLPPLNTGGFAIDLAFTIVFVLALILRSVAFAL